MTDLEAIGNELRNLLDLMHSRPSEDWTRERERVDELNRAIALSSLKERQSSDE